MAFLRQKSLLSDDNKGGGGVRKEGGEELAGIKFTFRKQTAIQNGQKLRRT